MKNREWLSHFDWHIFLPTLALSAIGFALLYSAGFQPGKIIPWQAKHQAISLLVGFAGFVCGVLLHGGFWRRTAIFWYAVGVVVLVLVLVNGVVAGGARRWLSLGLVRVQPSEFVKLAMILVLARILSRERHLISGYGIAALFLPALAIGLPMYLIGRQPDLGTALSFGLVGASMILVAGLRRGLFLKLFLLGSALLYPAWLLLKDYQRKRILTFLSPESDPLGSGYHAIQSKIALGSGSLTGKGFLQGTQTQLRFLPEQTTDFIFSVLGEEWGFLGSIVVLGLYLFLLLRIFQVANRSEDYFSTFVCVGVASLLFWHIIINIGMATGLLPVVGLTLPLLSFGGSSVVTFLCAIGIVTGISSRRFMFAT